MQAKSFTVRWIANARNMYVYYDIYRYVFLSVQLESQISHKTKQLIVQCGMSLLQSLMGICVCVFCFCFFLWYFNNVI